LLVVGNVGGHRPPQPNISLTQLKMWNRFQPRNRVSAIILGAIPRFIKETRFLSNTLLFVICCWLLEM